MLNSTSADKFIRELYNVAAEGPTATPEQRAARELSILLADLRGTLPVDKLTIGVAERLTEAVRDIVARNQVLHGTVDHTGHAIA